MLNLLALGNRGSARARKLSARGEDNQFGKSKFHNMRISDYRYLEKVFKHLQQKLNLEDDAPPIGIDC